HSKHIMAGSGNKRRNRIILWSVVIGVALAIAILTHSFSLHQIHSWGEHMNGWLLLALMAFLPLVGVPMSVLCIMAGAKFGPWEGLGATAVAVSINLILSWWMMRSWL